MAPTRAVELRKQSKEELLKQLKDLKSELLKLRISKVASSNPQNLSKLRVVRKSIARVLTVMNQKTRASVAKFWREKKYSPTDLRKKKTRAIRRKLTKTQVTKKTRRAERKEVKVARFAVRSA
ncbi:putative 60S ribosomal protein L35 [Blattamonas nauphoetae]|uniref:60S ribosomal protein L35 n=1 Tax=Blattamonas nauphoetae TaxID=2049346 RepID=A0ABQ9XBN1_9EUKA|nr:putative 60S ribosomal protein L35 [Blattamonas nauphoetae]KAK2962188.1 putative 60S ribosomal protein L35 [Blattamonas nauphoetae]